MATKFKYEARDTAGKVVKGTVSAGSQSEAVAALWLAPQIHTHPHAHEIGAALARDAPLRRALREFLAPLVR